MIRLGEDIVTGVAMKPADSDGTAIVGEIVDRLGFDGAVLTALFGDTTGAPTALSVPLKVYHGNEDDLSDAVEVTSLAVAVVDPAAGSKQEIDVNLIPLKRYIRLDTDPEFTGGTTPKIEIAGAYALGKKKYGPAS